MSMKEDELFDLCKEVYEKTGWKVSDALDDWFTTYLKGTAGTIARDIPLYTSDYLLEKLPATFNFKRLHIIKHDNGDCTARYRHGLGKRSDNALKALLKLTLALHEAGELE